MSARPCPLVLVVISIIGVAAVAACGGDDAATPDAPGPIGPTANPAREILDTQLAYDVTALTGTASITFGPSTEPGATLEVGDLVIDTVRVGGVDLDRAPGTSAPPGVPATLDLALEASDQPITVDLAFRYMHHPGFQGASAAGFTLVWPYHCGNLFPCHSTPSDGTTMSLALTGVPAGETAVYPAMITEAPSYQVAWAIDDYTELSLGTTTGGTEVAVWYRPNELANMQSGTTNLLAVFEWLEHTIGPYRFGPKAGSVSVRWGPGAFGGMEHHPLWHISSNAIGSEETHAHEAAHGWFGGGIRIACWEDFVLSEGTTTYLAARALDVVAPTVGEEVWNGYASDLAGIPGTDKVWPQTCGTIDIVEDELFTTAPYIRGAFFYRAVALEVGAELLDQALAAFYVAHAGKAARMSDMLATIQTVTGYDATACADMWLQSTTKPAPNVACP